MLAEMIWLRLWRSSRQWQLHCVQRTLTYIFWITLSKLTDFNYFWQVKSWENLTWKSYRFFHLSTSPGGFLGHSVHTGSWRRTITSCLTRSSSNYVGHQCGIQDCRTRQRVKVKLSSSDSGLPRDATAGKGIRLVCGLRYVNVRLWLRLLPFDHFWVSLGNWWICMSAGGYPHLAVGR